MKKKELLYYLIKSLNKTEKRYFKQFCLSSGEQKKYQEVFDAFAKQKELDESKLKTKWKGEKFLRQFHVIKNYLHHLILKSLRNYYAEQSKYAQALDGLRNIEILFRKELFRHCQEEIQRVKKIALEYEYQAILLELLKWQRRLLLHQSGRMTNELQALMQEEQMSLQTLERSNAYWQLTFDVFQYRKEQKDDFWQQPCMQYNGKEGLQNQIQRTHILYTYYTINDEAEKGQALLTALIAELEQHPHRIRETPAPYATALNNLIGAHFFSNQKNDVWPLLSKVKTIPSTYKLKQRSPFTIRLQLRTYNLELELLRDEHRWEDGIRLIGEVEPFLKHHTALIPKAYFILLAYQFAYIYFKAGQLGDALRWCNALLNKHDLSERLDIQVYARFLNLMVHFEMDNIFVLKYAVENSRRFFRKEAVKAIIPDFAPLVFRFFSKLSNTPKRGYALLFQQLYTDLFESNPPVMTKQQLDYLDLKAWIKSR